MLLFYRFPRLVKAVHHHLFNACCGFVMYHLVRLRPRAPSELPRERP